MRDAESILDQMISLGKETLSAEVVRKALGLIDLEVYFQFTDIIKSKNSAKVLDYARSIFTTGHDLVDYVHGLQEHIRNFLLVKTLKDTQLLDVSDYYKKLYEEKVTSLEEKDLIHYLQILIDAEQHIKFSAFPELDLEMLLLRIVHKPPSTSLEEILALIEKMKRGFGLDSNENKHHLQTEIDQSNRPMAQSDSKSASQENTVKEEVSKTTRKNFSSLEGTLKNLTGLKKQVNKTQSKEKLPPDIDLSALKEKWTEIINRVRTQKIALGAFLEEGIPFRLDKSHLIIAYDKKASFHQEHVQKNSKVIEEILKKDFMLPLRIGFQTIDFESEGIERIPRTPEEILEDIKNKEPIIKKIIEVFDLDESSHTDQS
jgi:DNA polymerase-3 subunit gamma/tau